ncbi:hypothetical protein [Kitasatospora cineracea]|uniref:hypothetical protein n=1 Tax=Kitasatospora cineracea TaxID=88074 RepID=UPI003824510D
MSGAKSDMSGGRCIGADRFLMPDQEKQIRCTESELMWHQNLTVRLGLLGGDDFMNDLCLLTNSPSMQVMAVIGSMKSNWSDGS